MKKYNLDDKSFEKYRAASKEQVNTLLSNVYTEGFEAGKKSEQVLKKPASEYYLTEDEFKDLIGNMKGIGATRRSEMIKKFIDINNNRRKANATG